MDLKGKKRKITEENRGFNVSWTESFAFIANAEGLPECLLCSEKLSNNTKSTGNVRWLRVKSEEDAAAFYPGTDLLGICTEIKLNCLTLILDTLPFQTAAVLFL